nr:putative transposase [Rhodococcus sp. JVH1]
MIAAVPAKPWRRISAGDGAHGPREYSWARVPIRIAWAPGRGHWLLARRSLSDATEIAYYICAGPRRTTLTGLATVAGSRWRVEECFQQAKNEAGLDQYQVRTYRAWYAHTTFSMLALSWLAGTKPQAVKGGSVSPNRA